ncbi:hypothetical protein [Nocardia sp. 2TAF39]|uniref:hypothetical protein n=1 Tax=unclassified Nocardia TaxID=2637762 RepID=UPI003F9866E8
MLDRRLGAPAVRIQTASHVAALETMWRTANGSDRRSIARAQSDTAALAAWQDLDVGNQASASKHYARARRAASRAGDPIMLAHAIGEHAILLAETGHATVALTQVNFAEAFPGLPPLLRCWLSATRAQVAAATPGNASIARAALACAEADLAHSRPGDEVELPFISLDAVHLQRWQGHVLVRLGDPAGSKVCRSAFDELPAEFVRAQSAQLLDLAEGALGIGELDEAENLLSVATPRITRLGSGRLKRRHDLLTRRVASNPVAV